MPLGIGRGGLSVNWRLGKEKRRRAAGAAPAFDADAQVIIAAMEPEPDATRQGHINDFVVALKDAGVWGQLDFLHVYAAHSEQAGLLNWKSPGTHNATAVNAPTFTVDRGFAGDGSTSYLNTNFVPGTDGVQYTLNNASLGVYSRTDINSGAFDFGARINSATAQAMLASRASGNAQVRLNGGGSLTSTVADSLGFLVGRRIVSDRIQIWKNGVYLTDGENSANGLPTTPMLLCCYNDNGTPTAFSTRQLALAFAGAAMSEAEQLSFSNAVEAFLDVLGAGVVD